MKRNVRHIHARDDEYIHVHRGGGSSGGGSVWVWKIVLALVGLIIAVQILQAIGPFLILGLMGYGALKCFGIFK